MYYPHVSLSAYHIPQYDSGTCVGDLILFFITVT